MMELRMPLWTYVDRQDRDVLRRWAAENAIQKRDLARLDAKLDMLVKFPLETLLQSHAIAGPINKTGHIYKVRVNGNVAIRIMFCRGPMLGESGYTLLQGAVERDRRLIPSDAPERAARHRGDILADGVNRRKPYVRFN